MLKAIIELVCLTLAFLVVTATAWAIVACTMMVIMWDDAMLNPMRWPPEVFYPSLAVTLIIWMGVLIFIEIARHEG
jgi:hypothetical protein